MDTTAKVILGSLSLGLLVGTSQKSGSTNKSPTPFSFDAKFIDQLIESNRLKRDFSLSVIECNGKDTVFILIDNGAKQVALGPDDTCWYWEQKKQDTKRYKVNTTSSRQLLEIAKELSYGIKHKLLKEE